MSVGKIIYYICLMKYIFISLLLFSCAKKSDYRCTCNGYGHVYYAGTDKSEYYKRDLYYGSTLNDAEEKCSEFSNKHKNKYKDTVALQKGWIECRLENIYE